MKTEQRIKEIREELSQLYKNDNDAPRLIAEMLEEFTPLPWEGRRERTADDTQPWMI